MSQIKKYQWLFPGSIATIIVLSLILLSLAGIFEYTNIKLIQQIIGDEYIQRIIFFTIYQSLLSALLSIIIALPLALSVRKYLQYKIIKLILSLAWLSFVLPVIIGVFAIIKLHGVSGWFSDISVLFGYGKLNYIYGMNGILLAHIFFNVPFAIRIILFSLNSVPAELWRIAIQNNFNRWNIFTQIEWPAIRYNLFVTAAIIFSLCFTSFVVVLILGGGPKYSIIEVALYYALKIEFNIDRAVSLGIIQIFIASCIVLIILSFTKSFKIEPYTKLKLHNSNIENKKSLAYDFLMLIVAILIFLLPILALIISCLTAFSYVTIFGNPGLLNSIYWTLLLGLSSGIISIVFSIMLLITIRKLIVTYRIRWLANLLELSGNLILILPPVLLGTGIFLSLRNIYNIQEIAPYIIIGINTLTVIPFTLRIIGPEYLRVSYMYDKLFYAYDIRGFTRLLKYELPLLRGSFATAFAVAVTLSMGDLGVISLFGSTEIRTLPLYIYQSLGSYRMDNASVGIFILLMLVISIIFISEYLLGGRDD